MNSNDLLTDLAKGIRFDNASKGFDPTEGGVERYLLLTISEICEGQNELRDGHTAQAIYHEGLTELPWHAGASLETFPADKKPEGFPVELADAIIRILDIQAKLELKIEILRGAYKFDPNVTLDRELLSLCRVIAQAGEPQQDMQFKLNLALSGLFQIAENLQLDIMNVIELKLAFNRTRPPKHGRKF